MPYVVCRWCKEQVDMAAAVYDGFRGYCHRECERPPRITRPPRRHRVVDAGDEYVDEEPGDLREWRRISSDVW